MSIPKVPPQIGQRTLWIWLVGVSLISFSLLAFEITLTRILSVMLSYHYVFIVVSLALLGLGLGGVFVHILRLRAPQRNPLNLTTLFASLFSLSIPVSVIVVTQLAGLNVLGGSILSYLVILILPYFLAGALLSEIFRSLSAFSSRLYGMDLIGAASGSLGVVFLLNNSSGVGSSLLLAAIAAAAALLINLAAPGRNTRKVTISVASLLVVVGLLGADLTGVYRFDVPVTADPAKEINRALKEPTWQGEILETRWSAFGRTDLVAVGADPGTMNLYLDGTAGTAMYQFAGDITQPTASIQSLKTEFPGYLPLSVLGENEKNNALIIGPGGGRDILLALLGGVEKITAVEVNKELVEIVKEYAWYNGGIYTGLENVEIVVDEGRNFLKRQDEKYDLIMLSLPVTKTSRSLEGYALTESFLFTTDSINDYSDHLTNEGRLVVVAHDPVELSKLLSVAVAALNQRGADNEAAMGRIYMIGNHMYPVLVLKKTPFEPQEMETIHRSIHELNYDPATSYVPTIRQGECTPHEEGVRYDECAMLNPAFIALSTGRSNFDDFKEIFRGFGLDINPVSDDNPFFYKFERGIPGSVSLVFWPATVTLLLAIALPLWRRRRRAAESNRRRESSGSKLPSFLVLFSLLGIGFMLVEISTIQRFTLFLGQPVLSVAIILFSILVGAGLGSISSGRVPSDKIVKTISVVCFLITVWLTLYAVFLPTVLEQFLGLDLAWRIGLTMALTTPLGFLLGFPFPSGLRLLKEAKLENYIPWMWGVNGLASVVGSTLTIVAAITLGFTAALILAAVTYFIVSWLFFSVNRRGLAWVRTRHE